MFGHLFHTGRSRPVFYWLLALLFVSSITAPGMLRAHAGDPGAAQEGAPPDSITLPRKALLVGSRRIKVEVAADPASQSRGLMYRKHLPKDHGMLFVFPSAEQRCFWMKNTLIPLTIAYIDSGGIIQSLADMQPQSLEPHCSIAPAQYALEMEQGWFARHGLGPGTRITAAPQ